MNESTDTGNVYFTFILGDGAFAVDVRSVKEVLTYETITKVPRTASYMKGVMNVRGTVVSVIDFRMLFDIPASAEEKETSIIVTEVTAEDEQPLTFGFIADGVDGVGELEDVVSQDVVSAGSLSMHNKFIKKLGRKGDDFVLILDMEKILEHVESDPAEQARMVRQ